MVAVRIPGPENIENVAITRDPGVQATPAAFGAQIGAAQAAEGAAIARLGETAVQVGAYLDRKRSDAAMAVALPEAHAEFQQYGAELAQEKLKTTPASAKIWAADYDANLEKRQDQIIAEKVQKYNLSKEAAARIQGNLISLRGNFVTRGVTQANNNIVLALSDQTIKNRDAIVADAAGTFDVDGGLQRVDDLINSQRPLLGDEATRKLLNESRDKVVQGTILALQAAGREEDAKAIINRFYGSVPDRLDQKYVEAIKGFEGFTETSVWDYKQFSSGYGTRENAAGIRIDKAEAERRLNRELTSAAAIVDKVNPNLPPGPRAALISLTFNAGSDWTKQGLGNLVRSGDLQGAKQKLLEYNKAGGQVLPGLESRRAAEASWFDNAAPAVNPKSAPIMPDFEKAVRLHNAMEISHAQREGRNISEAEKARKQIGEEYLKEAFKRAETKSLDDDFIEEARPYLSASDYRALLKTQRDDPASDDRQAIADLTTHIDAEDPVDFQKRALSHLEQGKLKTTTYTQMVERNRNASKDDRPTSPYKTGREYVKQSLEPGMLVDGPARLPLAAAQTGALTEFDNWAEANPRASRADALAQAQEITKRYATISTDQMISALGVSRYFGPKSRREITDEIVNEGAQKLALDIESGRLTKAQADYEIRLINNWREAIAKQKLIEDQARANRKPKP